MGDVWVKYDELNKAESYLNMKKSVCGCVCMCGCVCLGDWRPLVISS